MILSKGIDGATTVAITMLCADLAGIRVFAIKVSVVSTETGR